MKKDTEFNLKDKVHPHATGRGDAPAPKPCCAPADVKYHKSMHSEAMRPPGEKQK